MFRYPHHRVPMEITRSRRRFHRLRLAQKRPLSWYMMPGNWVVHSEEIQQARAGNHVRHVLVVL